MADCRCATCVYQGPIVYLETRADRDTSRPTCRRHRGDGQLHALPWSWIYALDDGEAHCALWRPKTGAASYGGRARYIKPAQAK